MRTFTLYVHDSRYSVPNLVFADAADVKRVRELAEGELGRSEQHLAVDVREGEAWLFRVQRNGNGNGEFDAWVEQRVSSSAP
jgi:hypothetical protein